MDRAKQLRMLRIRGAAAPAAELSDAAQRPKT